MKEKVFYLKDWLKDRLHKNALFPYRKKSKRRKTWSHKNERIFIDSINKIYSNKSDRFDCIEVSIIMPVHNRAYCIQKAINSIINQTHKNWELIIVDDGSSDNLIEKTQCYLDDNRIKLIRKKWGGVSSARNTGIDYSTGKYLFYLDTDNIWVADYLRRMIVFMEIGNLKNSYAGVQIVNETGDTIGYYGEEFDWIGCLELNYIDINCFAHQAKVVNDGLRFDEHLKRFVDWDFILAVTSIERTAYAPFLGVKYYDGDQGNRITFTEYIGEEKALLQTIRDKHMQLNDSEEKNKSTLRPQWTEILNTAQKFNF